MPGRENTRKQRAYESGSSGRPIWPDICTQMTVIARKNSDRTLIVMANVYYCNSASRGASVLRAVLSSEEGQALLTELPAQYAGPEFPARCQEINADFALLRIFEGEMSREWRTGFYRFHADLMRIEEVVHSFSMARMTVATK